MKKKMIIISILLVIMTAIFLGIYQFFSVHLFDLNGESKESNGGLKNYINSIENEEERLEYIEDLLEKRIISEKQAKELLN